jgi:hypothetical protein
MPPDLSRLLPIRSDNREVRNAITILDEAERNPDRDRVTITVSGQRFSIDSAPAGSARWEPRRNCELGTSIKNRANASIGAQRRQIVAYT